MSAFGGLLCKAQLALTLQKRLLQQIKTQTTNFRQSDFSSCQKFTKARKTSPTAMSGPAISCFQEVTFAETFSTTAAMNDDLDKYDAAGVDASRVIDLAQKALELQTKSGVSVITVERTVGDLCDAYVHLQGEEAQMQFLLFLANRTVDRSAVRALAKSYADESAPEMSLTRLEGQLRVALESPYVWLFQRIGQLAGGVKFLVDVREHMAEACRATTLGVGELAAIKTMNGQLKQLLAHWFSVGFLDLQRVTWDSSCSMLQKISDYEAVHPMRSWADLKARVGPYRRCFVYTHKSMPGEPIVVLHVALKDDIPGTISSVVKHHRLIKRFSVDAQPGSSSSSNAGEDLSAINSAIFYSINSTQKGLQGIELGTYLIKQAVHRLKEELPGLAHFATLSPIPGFKNWLLTTMQTARRGETEEVFSKEEMETFQSLLQCDPSKTLSELYELIRSNRWAQDDVWIRAMEAPLTRVCARYLYLEKRRGLALDSVANFHLRNGAVLWRINWRGDFSPRGLDNSCGIMVNYMYDLGNLEANSTAYQESHLVTAGEKVVKLIGKMNSS